jgi:hypothetical protein
MNSGVTNAVGQGHLSETDTGSARQVKKVCSFYGKPRFITLLIRGRHWSFWARLTQTTFLHSPFNIDFNIIFTSTFRSRSCFLISDFRIKFCVRFSHVPSMSHVAHFICLYSVILITVICDEVYKLWTFLLRNFLQIPAASFCGLNILLSTLCSDRTVCVVPALETTKFNAHVT